MAKRKIPQDLTPEQMQEYKTKDTISNHATRSEKTSWERQFGNLEKLVKKLEPIEDKLMSLMSEKSTIIDELMALRRTLVEHCIHPFDQLVAHDGFTICKFCERKLVSSNGETKATD